MKLKPTHIGAVDVQQASWQPRRSSHETLDISVPTSSLLGRSRIAAEPQPAGHADVVAVCVAAAEGVLVCVAALLEVLNADGDEVPLDVAALDALPDLVEKAEIVLQLVALDELELETDDDAE